ncbi:MAG: chloride channel protein [Deltaproteobacteria bacterium]|nr:chloride channel protein [Deltaproteobacteria bacterium]MBW1815562.1 chloride channel protein [Deltaproteobacteria bacterium]
MNRSSLYNLLTLKSVWTNEHAIMTILAMLVGLAGGFGAIGFRWLISFCQRVFYGSGGELLDVLLAAPWYAKIWVPAAGGLIVGPLVYFLAREAKGHGVPEVMAAVALHSGIIRKRIVVIKSLASAVSIGSGGSVGREGPIVQIGSAIGSVIGQLLNVSADRIRTLVGCGAAAGIAATFNAPIAGAMFALEIVLGDFGLATFSPIVISAVSATAVSRHFLGDFPAFVVPAYELASKWEFPLYITLGLFCSFVAVAFTRFLYLAEDLFDDFKFPEYLKALLGGVILGIVGLLFPSLLGVGYGGIDACLGDQLAWWMMFVLVFGKIVATSITIGSGGSGGIFAPSLFIGAMAGGFFGTAAHALFPEIASSPGAYSIVGMGAVVAGTTHAPLSAILILFEMTGDYKIILPLMTACIISSLTAGQLFTESIYTLKLARRGVNLKAGREVNVLKSISVRSAMNPDIDTVREGMSLGELADKISKSKYNSFPVVNSEGHLAGILSFLDYKDVAFDTNLKDLVVAKELATANVVTVSVDDNLYDALEKITSKDFSILPVVSPADPTTLLGILTRRDIIGAYDKGVIKRSLLDK